MLSNKPAPIGIFDSGYGGLTILSDIKKHLPQYDYIYMGDNARAPYGNRSFELIYKFTLQAVDWFFRQGCHLVILACNTASSKALRNIQQKDLPLIDPSRRVLGVIRPTIESIKDYTKSNHVGVLATEGTVQSHSYKMEIAKLFPNINVVEEACPMWVPLVENSESDKEGADYFIKQHINNILLKSDKIDCLILGCTHYPLLENKIKEHLPSGISTVSQGVHVAKKLQDYLMRHPEMESKCSKGGETRFFTTESPEKFDPIATIVLREEVNANKIEL